MAEPISVAVLLEAFAVAAGQKFGKKMAEEFSKALFDHLATKEDLDTAVQEIKNFVRQEIRDHEERTEIIMPLYSAFEHMENWKAENSKSAFDAARDDLINIISALKTRQEHDNSTYRRLFVYLCKTLTASVALETNHFLSFKDWKTRQDTLDEFSKDLIEYSGMIETAIKSIEDFQYEKATNFRIESTTKMEIAGIAGRPIDIPHPGDRDKLILIYQAVWDRFSKKYDKGNSMNSGDYAYTKEDAEKSGLPKFKEDEQRIERERQAREKLYEAARDFSNALKGMEKEVLMSVSDN